jgi:hypothetical protein
MTLIKNYMHPILNRGSMLMEECCSLNIVGRGSLKATSLLSISDGTKKTLCLSRHETQAPKTRCYRIRHSYARRYVSEIFCGIHRGS